MTEEAVADGKELSARNYPHDPEKYQEEALTPMSQRMPSQSTMARVLASDRNRGMPELPFAGSNITNCCCGSLVLVNTSKISAFCYNLLIRRYRSYSLTWSISPLSCAHPYLIWHCLHMKRLQERCRPRRHQ